MTEGEISVELPVCRAHNFKYMDIIFKESINIYLLDTKILIERNGVVHWCECKCVCRRLKIKIMFGISEIVCEKQKH